MKDEKIDSFYLRSLIVILSTTILTLIGLHSLQFILILFPVLFIVNIIQDGLSEGLANMMMTLIIISIVESIPMGIFLAIAFVPFTIIISLLIKKRKGNVNILGYSSVAFFGSILFMMLVIKLTGTDIVKLIEESSREVFDMQLEAFKNLGLGKYELFIRTEMLEDRYKYVLLIIPATLLILSSVASYINYLLSGIILERLGIKIVNIPRFSKLKLPENIIIGVILMFAITFIAGQVGFIYYETVFINIGVLLMMGFFIQGLSVGDFFLNRLKMKPIFKVIFYIIFLLNPAMIPIVTMLGIIDTVIDLRKIRKPRSL